MICDSRQGFEFSWLNSLLSWAFSQQGKKIKISGIINGSMTFRWYESYKILNTELLIRLLFLVLVLSILFTIESTNLKTSYSQFSDQTYINLTNIFDFIG